MTATIQIELGHKKNPATCANRSGAMAIVGKDDHMQKTTCGAPACASTAVSKGWCNKHYQRWRRHGDPTRGHDRYATATEAFRANTQFDANGCLIWTGTLNPAGYGNIQADGRTRSVHRYAWEQTNGPIPEGLLIDHTCHVPACCNVEHLRLATTKQNIENMLGARSDNAAGIRGVRRVGAKWEVRACHYGKAYSGGLHDTAEQAERAAIELRNSLFTHNDHDRIAS